MERKIDTGQIFSEAFDYWKSVMRFNLAFSMVYFGLFMLLTYGLANYLGVWEKFMEIRSVTDVQAYVKKLNELAGSKDVILFSLLSVFCSGLAFPLHIGFFKIFKKIDNKEEPVLGDLFEGYQGANFIRYAVYYILWMMIYRFMSQLVFPAPLWVMLTLFVPPLMYFRNEPLGMAMVTSFQAMRGNFLTLLICVIGTAFISYLGLVVFLVGYALTFPFWNAMIYTLYKNIFTEEINNNL